MQTVETDNILQLFNSKSLLFTVCQIATVKAIMSSWQHVTYVSVIIYHTHVFKKILKLFVCNSLHSFYNQLT